MKSKTSRNFFVQKYDKKKLIYSKKYFPRIAFEGIEP